MATYKMKISFLCLLFLTSLVQGQHEDFDTARVDIQLSHPLAEQNVFKVYVDKLQQIYVLDSAGEITKYDQHDTFRYRHFGFGDISHLDVTNPHKVLVFYPGFQAVIVLDDEFTELQTLDLETLDLNYTGQICSSGDGKLWLYDEGEHRLKKVDFDNRQIVQSEPTYTFLDRPLDAAGMIERNNRVMIYDGQQGILVFDIFAQMKNGYR